MGLIARDTGGGADFLPPPEGSFLARCVKLIDLGTQYSERWNKSNRTIMVSWELPTELMEGGEFHGKPYLVSKRYTLSLGEKANLRKDLESWRGKKFTVDELKGFDLEAVLGAPCMLSIVHNASEATGRTYANVSAVMAVPKGTAVPAQVTPSVLFNVEAWDQAVFDSLSAHVQETINASEEAQGMKRNDNPTLKQTAPEPAPVVEDEIDIPF